MRVAFIGVGYFPTKMTSEKNFFLNLVSRLRGKVDDVIVISVNDQEVPKFSQDTPHGPVPIYNFKRPFHRHAGQRFYRQVNGVHAYHHRHGVAQEMLEKFATIYVHADSFKAIMDAHRIDLIYFMDNFGFGMRYLRRKLGIRTAFVASNYDPRGRLYNGLQKAFIGGLDSIVTYSAAYKAILSEIGVDSEKIKLLHWGIDPAAAPPLSAQAKAEARRNHGVADGSTLVLWTGYIQQIQELDFLMTSEIAAAIRQRRDDIEFVFCFKPETFKPEYKSAERPGIQVMSGSPDFRSLLGSADLLISPTHKLSSTVSPPLTWTEAMSMGVPVLTTAVKGADEIIVHGQTGFITRSYDTLGEDMESILTAGIPDGMAAAAMRKIDAEYNINTIANQFVATLGETQ
jgi:glycosyltransferase involved in cell wall biosynthesis